MTDVLRERLLPLLDGVRKSGAGFDARCPAHDDSRASLSVGVGKDRDVVLHCHVGCEPDDILAKLKLTWADLAAPHDALSEPEWTPAGPAIAVYDYCDERNSLLYQVLRTADKQFRQRVPDSLSKTGWTWRLGDVRRVLYRLPKVIEAVRAGQEIYVCEGEKDVHTLASRGVVATCNSGGAGKWRPEFAEPLRDAAVVITADCDEPGRAHARQVAASLTGVAATVCILEPAVGKDVTDHLLAGRGLEDLVLTWADHEEAKPDLAPDLWEFIHQPDEEFRWIVPDLLERGDRLMLTGFEGLGKSMLVRQLAVMIAAGLHPFTYHGIQSSKVLLIDCENSIRQSRRKFRTLATASIRAMSRVPDGGLRIIHRSEGIDLTRDEDAAWLLERVVAHQPDVLFIGPFYRLHCADMNEELPARRVIAALDAARTKVDCALVVEAHAGHGEPGRRRSVRPVGSSLQLRWPEFGYGLVPATDDWPCRDVLVKGWRGPRDDRKWPERLTWGDPWPWMEAS